MLHTYKYQHLGGRGRKKDPKSEVSLGFIARSCLKQTYPLTLFLDLFLSENPISRLFLKNLSYLFNGFHYLILLSGTQLIFPLSLANLLYHLQLFSVRVVAALAQTAGCSAYGSVLVFSFTLDFYFVLLFDWLVH